MLSLRGTKGKEGKEGMELGPHSGYVRQHQDMYIATKVSDEQNSCVMRASS